MDERTGEFLENYSQNLPEVEVVLTPPHLDEETYSSDFSWPDDDEMMSKKRKYTKKVNSFSCLIQSLKKVCNGYQEAAKKIPSMVSKKPKKMPCLLQPSSKVKASKPKCDGNGIFTLYILKNELDDELNPKLDACLWRRDGNELLQKYLRLHIEDNPEIFFISTPVYAIWEDQRRDEYLGVKVKYAEADNDSKVQLVAIDMEQGWEEQAVIEYSEDSIISFDDGSCDGPSNGNCIIIEEIFENEAESY